ncbi:MAG: sulfatase [Gemmatimonadaceae bacterium]
MPDRTDQPVKEHNAESPSATPLGSVGVLLVGGWFALATSGAELVLVGIMQFMLDRYLYYGGPHLIWMTPLASLTVFSVPALIMGLVAWWRPGAVTLRTAVTVYAFLLVLSVLFFQWHRLHRAAIFVLAVGLAVQAGRMAAARAGLFVRIVRVTTPIVAALMLVAITATKGTMLWAEHRALARLPAATAGSPSVILLILDTVRAHNLSVYGYHRATTPNLQRLARSGVRFDWAFSTAPWTLPSHASILTGRFPHETSVNWVRPLDGTHPTLAEVLSARGYLTAGFVANTDYCSRESGLDRGFAHYKDFAFTPGHMFYSSSLVRNGSKSHRLRHMLGYYQMLGRKSAEQVNGEFVKWLSGNDRGRPFFAFLNFLDAHAPYLPPAPFHTRFGNGGKRRNPLLTEEANRKLGPGDSLALRYLQSEVDAYDNSLAYLDHQIGQLLGELERRNLLHNTIVIVTSDHGEGFAEHQHLGHGEDLHTPALHVPLLISFPGRIPAGVTVPQPVSVRDIPSTVAALVGIGGEAPFPGKSLGRYWGSGGALVAADTVLSSEEDMISLVTAQHHFLTNSDGTEQLFQYRADPGEQRNVLGSEGGREIAQRLRAFLPPALSRDLLAREERK